MTLSPDETAVVEIVDTPEEAASLALAPLLVREPVERFLDEHGLGSGPDHGDASRRGAFERHLLRPPRRRPGRPAPPAASAAAPVGARHDARGARPARSRGLRRPRSAGARDVSRRVAPRRALLRHGVPRRLRADARHAARARGRERACCDRGADGGRPRRTARGRLRGLRAGRLRQADGIPGAPAAPLRRAVGGRTHARAARVRRADRLARATTCRRAVRRRSCTATTGSAT